MAGTQARLYHARVIENQNISSTQESCNVWERTVLDSAGESVQRQQPRLIAPRRGRLRNESLRQIEIEIAGAHGRNVE